jgi:hypothetical protein
VHQLRQKIILSIDYCVFGERRRREEEEIVDAPG